MKKLSFVIPCYQSERTIVSVVQEIIDTVKIRPEYAYEIVLVSDNSPDHVFDVIKKLAKETPCIKGIQLSANFGQHAALLAGYRECTGDVVVSLDDDGQTPANEVFSLIDKLEEGYDVVYASYSAIHQNRFRVWGSRVNQYMMRKLLGKPRGLETTSYFACRNYVIHEVVRYENAYPYVGGLILRITKNIGNVPVQHRDRQAGKSGYSLRKLLNLWMNGFTAFSVKPLRLATITGIVCATIGFLYGLYTIVHKLMNPATPAGWSSMMAALLFIGGIIMLILGMIGEYIGRIYICINSSPQYVIREVVNIDAEESKKNETK